jgi:hypothetical protein
MSDFCNMSISGAAVVVTLISLLLTSYTSAQTSPSQPAVTQPPSYDPGQLLDMTFMGQQLRKQTKKKLLALETDSNH